jgi:phthiocerol/phenolphthiocerol synthesis type-I polyketide synthase E
MKSESMEQLQEHDIAIIGMAGRFPRAKDIAGYWQNLAGGINCIVKTDEEQLYASGFSANSINNKRFVNASARLEDAKFFDADFFGLSNMEAMHMDPQIRLLLQTSWHAIEDAGYDMSRSHGSVGNFCGMSSNTYLLKVMDTNAFTEQVDPLLYRILSEKDFLATWISYKLNLTGPAMTVQTACSTSLLAVHLACQSLLNRECDMALVGGVSFDAHENPGYFYTPESIYSKDGKCRPFDRDASGTVNGDGVGAVVLKRASEAIKDKDHIYALIKGTATNNDGANKQGYTTPSVNLQRDVILEAVSVADINPESIGLIEAHGTGTLIGDPIEVAALTEAFREYTDKVQYCAIGSVKGNIGHLDAAAGIASLIKTVLCINKGLLVPSINFSNANPSLQLNTSPFYVSASTTPWPRHFEIRRAGISSLGVGGSNVHIIIEEPPLVTGMGQEERPYVVTLSSLNRQNLHLQKKQLAGYISTHQEITLPDIEFTSIYGRKVLPYRFSVVCQNKDELIAQLNGVKSEGCYEGHGSQPQSVFMFPGQGSQYANMAMALYRENKDFKSNMDYCFEYLESISPVNFKDITFSERTDLLDRTENTQVCLFIVEYCLARELMKLGIKPDAIIGHSLGEYVAACIVGCISLHDALLLVYHRGRLMGMMPGGAMLLVRARENVLAPLLLNAISVCVFNADDNIVVGGSKVDINEQIRILQLNKIEFRELKVSHAYHTPMMNDVLAEYDEILSGVEFKDFNVAIFSTYTGDLVRKEIFSSKEYWLNQIINPVRFSEAVQNASTYLHNPLFIEVGPGNGLSSFVQSISGQQANTINVLPKPSGKSNALHAFYEAKALLCVKGVNLDLPEVHEARRVHMPGYVFSKNRFWKPQINVRYENFSVVNNSYHHVSSQYKSDRLRSSIEVKLDHNSEISGELLNHWNTINTQYLNDLRELFSTNEKINNKIEVLYNEVPVNSEKASPDLEQPNHKRNISSVFVEPATETEKTMAKYWSNALGYHPAGILDNYFEVGGNSLLATKLLTQLSDEFEVTLSFKELSECQSIKELAILVESKKNALELVSVMEIGNNDNNCIEL